jgi:spore coat polysaccharide biosynthesis predicted glycosyltransferase SpsG
VEYLLNSIKFRNKKYHIIIGNSFKEQDDLMQLAKDSANIFLYNNPEKMSEIMQKSDVAISSGGSTLYEFMACGVPVIGFIYADNQKGIVETMERLGYIKNIGSYDNLNFTKFEQDLAQLLLIPEERKYIVAKTQNLIDCNGTERIIDVVKTYL